MTVPRPALAIAALLVVAVLGAARTMRGPGEYSETLYVFGTLVEIVIRDTDEVTARNATAEAGHLLQTLHRDWHAWRPGALEHLNAALADGQARQVDPALARVLQDGWILSCQSGGLFDPAVGRLIALWGFHDDTPPDGGLPDPSAIAALVRAAPRMTDLRFDGLRVWSKNPSVQLDLGAYAKGAALDRLEHILSAHGIDNAVLNAGGDVNAMGDHGTRPWRVAIRDPFGWGTVAGVDLRAGENLYTSGNYERFFEQDGHRFSHILDPRTGYPVDGIVSASVLDDSGARADAAATAISVAGPDHWPQVAADMDIDKALLISDTGQVFATRAMAARLTLLDGQPAAHVVDLPPPSPNRTCTLPNP